jgi:hypothetical protein
MSQDKSRRPSDNSEAYCWHCEAIIPCECMDATCRCGAPFDSSRCAEFRFYPKRRLGKLTDCEGCRQLKEALKATREASWEVQRQNRELKKQLTLSAYKGEIEFQREVIVELQQKITSLQNQLTEAQGKRGKVVSVEEIAKIVMEKDFEWKEMGFAEKDNFTSRGKFRRHYVATAIFKAVYGESQDGETHMSKQKGLDEILNGIKEWDMPPEEVAQAKQDIIALVEGAVPRDKDEEYNNEWNEGKADTVKAIMEVLK